jgi:hypothetical protein
MNLDIADLPNNATLPDSVAMDAWDGTHGVVGKFADKPGRFALQGLGKVARLMRPGAAASPRDFKDPRIGWALVLPFRGDLDTQTQARAEDAEPPFRQLLAARGAGAKVLRYRADYGVLALFESDGTLVPLSGAKDGVEHGALPDYLLLAGGPDVLPWSLQYALGASRCVGRLHLTGTALARHVSALLADGPPSRARYEAPVVWAVDLGAGDISSLMRNTIAAPIAAKFATDAEMPDQLFLDGSADPGAASVERLGDALSERRPALVVTSSHGLTGPIDDPSAMLRRLGLPVGQLGDHIDPAGLLTNWEPDGAVWFAQACCSAGSSGVSEYEELLDPNTGAGRVIHAIAGLGSQVAPLPTALLGAERPLKAFIGHVEPTFDWTISFPWLPTALTDSITKTVYEGFCGGEPIGLAMRRAWKHIGELRQAHATVLRYFDATPTARAQVVTAATYLRLAAGDRAATVLLGDPAASIDLPRT